MKRDMEVIPVPQAKGMVLCSRLFWTLSWVSAASVLHSAGSVPVKELYERSTAWRDVMAERAGLRVP